MPVSAGELWNEETVSPANFCIFALAPSGGRSWHLQGKEGIGWKEMDNGTVANVLLWTWDF